MNNKSLFKTILACLACAGLVAVSLYLCFSSITPSRSSGGNLGAAVPASGDLPGVYNSTSLSLADGFGSALATDSAGRVLLSPSSTISSFGHVSTTDNVTSTMQLLSLMGYAANPSTVLTINQKNTGSNRAVLITNAGTSNGIKIDQNGNSGRTDSSSGALLIDTTSVGNSFGANIYSQNNNAGNLLQVNAAPQYSTTGTSAAQWLGTTSTQLLTNYNGNYPSSGTILVHNGTSIGESNDSVFVTYASTSAPAGGPYSFNGVAGTFVTRQNGLAAVSGAQVSFIGTTTTWQQVRSIDNNLNGGVPDFYMIAPNPDFEMVARGGYDNSAGVGKFEIDVPAGNSVQPTTTDMGRLNGRDDSDVGYNTAFSWGRPGPTGQGKVAIGFQNWATPFNVQNSHLTVANSNRFGDVNNGALVVAQFLGSATNTQTAHLSDWGIGGDPPTIYSFINATGSFITSGYVSGTSGLFGNLTLASSTNNPGASVYLNYPGSAGLLSTATSGYSYADASAAGQMTSPTGTLYWVASGTNMYAAVIQNLEGSTAKGSGLAVDIRYNGSVSTGPKIVNFSSGGSSRLNITGSGVTSLGLSNPTNGVVNRLEVAGVASTTALTISIPGTNAAAMNALCISTTGTVNSQSTACSVSSARFKENINALSSDKLLAEVKALRAVSFDWKDGSVPKDGPNAGGKASTGFIAEEVAKVDPQLVLYVEGSPEDVAWEQKHYPGVVIEKDGKHFIPRSVDYARVSYVLTGAIQAQEERLAGIEARLSAVETRLSLWDKLWAALKAFFASL